MTCRGEPVPVGHHRGRADRSLQRVRPLRRRSPSPTSWSAISWWPRRPSRTRTSARRVILVLDHGLHGALGRGDRPPRRGRRRPAPAPVARRGHAARRAVHRWTGGAQLAHRPGPAGARAGRRRRSRPVVRRAGGCWSTTTGRWGPSTWAADPAAVRRVAGRAPGCSRAMPGGTAASWRTRSTRVVVRGAGRGPGPHLADPEGLWRRVLRRQGGALALVSGFPVGPDHQLTPTARTPATRVPPAVAGRRRQTGHVQSLGTALGLGHRRPQQLDEGPGRGRREPAAALGHADPSAGESGHSAPGGTGPAAMPGMAVAGRMAGP